ARHDWHVTRGTKWHWDRSVFARSGEPAQLDLSKGVVELTFSVREPDLRIDQLFISRDPATTPPESKKGS
ncbi:MAG: hypothetical protein JJ992_26915, partial [Planctomycetes bacterium]|nr:hypothetical protein [Planctomycetota bacterium]